MQYKYNDKIFVAFSLQLCYSNLGRMEGCHMKESPTLEFKREITNTFLKTVSAFANFGKGTIMFGVNDDGSPIGIKDPDKVSLDLENRINDSISPKPDYSISINRRTNVISLAVSEGRFKPYLYKGKAYRRSDTATVEVDQIELKRLTLEGENLYYEELPCNSEVLQFGYLAEKLKNILGISELSDDILRTFGFINRNKQFNIAGALFADQNQFSGIDSVRFGKSISEILDRETYAGMSVLRQYDSAIAMFKRYYQYEKIEGIERETVSLIPETAFREAIANALVHRTWDISAHIRISMYPDKTEIVSPGGLPTGITKDEYLNGYISNLRNPIIGNVFFRLHYIEMFGTGIRRIMDAYAESTLKPAFDITDNSVCVVLPIAETTFEVTAESKKAIDLLNGRMKLSSREIAEKLGWSKDKAIRVLNRLLEAGYIQKIGSGRGTRYLRK